MTAHRTELQNVLLQHVLLISLLLLIDSTLLAQREQAGLRAEYWGKSTYSDGFKGTLDAFTVQFNGGIRTEFGEEGETLLNTGVIYRYLSLSDVTNAAIPFSPQQDLSSTYHMLQLETTLLHSLSDDWTAVVSLRPGLFGDFYDIGGGHFRFEAAFFFDYITSETFTIGFGAAILPSNFGRVLPAVPLIHILNNGRLFGVKYLIDALLPQKADMTLYLTKSFEVGLSAALIGTNYEVSRVERRADRNADRLAFANATLSGMVRYNLFGTTYIFADVGYTALRRYEFSISNHAELGLEERPFSPKLPNVFFGRFGVNVLY